MRLRRFVLLATLLAPARTLDAQEPVADSLPMAMLLARADSSWRAERHAEALERYEAVLRRDAGSSFAVFRRATLLSYLDRLEEAIAGFRRYTELEPRDTEGRIALARALAWGARYTESLAIYDRIVATDSTYGLAVLGAAQALAWWGRYDDAIGRYRSWIGRHPEDEEARFALARTLSWAGELREAERMYRELSGAGRSAEAAKGIARVLGWRGELAASEAQWRETTSQTPDDPETWTGLAQVLRWQGRPVEAEVALRRALAIRPDYADARSMLVWVLADVRPSVEPTFVASDDSDANRTSLYAATASRQAPWLGRLLATAHRRDAGVGGVVAASTGLRLAATWRERLGRYSARAEIGGTHLRARRADSTAASRGLWLAAARGAWRATNRATFGLSAARTPFDETALLIERGIVVQSVGADADVTLPWRLSLSGGAERARLTGGPTLNNRRAGSATLRWTPGRRLSYAILGRAFGYDSSTRHGYFAPERYTLVEGSARLQVGREIGVSAGADAGIGAQTLRLTGSGPSARAAQRARGWMTWRPSPGNEVTATFGWANVASPGQVRSGDYSYTFVQLGGRVRLGRD